MNCNQVQKLLPLYVGRDLDDVTFKTIKSHLASCSSCHELNGQYEETQRLVQLLESPAFSESVYSDIRNSVLVEVQRRKVIPNSLEGLWDLFQRPAVWATSFATVAVAALLLTVFSGSLDRDNDTNSRYLPTLRDGRVGVSATASARKGSNVESRDGLASNSLRHWTTNKTPRRRMGVAAPSVTPIPTATNDIAATANVADTNPAVERDSTDTEEKTLKIEIQTSDPNIRILWLAKRTR
jgi:hypothetical protein